MTRLRRGNLYSTRSPPMCSWPRGLTGSFSHSPSARGSGASRRCTLEGVWRITACWPARTPCRNRLHASAFPSRPTGSSWRWGGRARCTSWGLRISWALKFLGKMGRRRRRWTPGGRLTSGTGRAGDACSRMTGPWTRWYSPTARGHLGVVASSWSRAARLTMGSCGGLAGRAPARRVGTSPHLRGSEVTLEGSCRSASLPRPT
mmetsp:Transcript_38083/g.120232  ORF Transcript_38083/g.120232 Transcript_38083/m.120232 type:complete len:204 (-) Transcript_38083:3714-4325(-)